jgi:large subunit ribosomal protein L21
MYAVIETGGKQYRVEVGTELEVELLDVEPGQNITLDRVLLVADGAEATVGTPLVDGAAVEAEVIGATRGEKVIAFKYRPKARRRVKKGHRQDLTVLRIADIRFAGKSAAGDAQQVAASKADERKRLEEAAARQAAEDAALAAKLNVATPEAEAPAAPKRSRAAAAEAVATPAADEAPETPETPAEAEAAPAADEEKATRAFEIFEDKGGQWRWRLRARNGELVAMSEQGFTTKAGVIRTLDVVRRNVAEAEGHEEIAPAAEGEEPKTAKGFEIFEDKGGQWRWRLRARNGELLAVTEQGFASRAGVVKTLDLVRRNVAEAGGHEEPEAADTSTPEAAPKRTRTKKDE